MQVPVIQKVVFNKEAFVERRLPSARGGSSKGKFFVEEGSKVRPFDFVARVPPARGGSEAPKSARGGRRLTAGVGGKVVRLLPGKAILIKSSAMIVRGVIGKGEDDEGEVRIAAKRDAPIEPATIDADCAGNILVGGFAPTLEVFKKAAAVGVRGIICGGADFSAFQKSDLPTLLVEGFGRPPLDNGVFEFLKKAEGRHVFLSPSYRRLLVARPQEGEKQAGFADVKEKGIAEVFTDLKVGMETQVFSVPRFGQVGKVGRIDGEIVEVLFADGEKIEVSKRNLGIIK